MKIRVGFVSNSSSSSFICDVSGEVVSGWDIGLSDAEMYQCEKGHTFLIEYAVCDVAGLPKDIKKDLVVDGVIGRNYSIDDNEEREADYIIRKNTFGDSLTDEEIDKRIEDEEYDENVQAGYDVPSGMCPICQFAYITDHDAKLFMLKKLNISEEGLETSIKNSFDSFQKFQNYILTVKE